MDTPSAPSSVRITDKVQVQFTLFWVEAALVFIAFMLMYVVEGLDGIARAIDRNTAALVPPACVSLEVEEEPRSIPPAAILEEN